MKRGILFGLVMVILLSGCRESELFGEKNGPKAPKGYEWQEFKEVHAASLKPRKWFYSCFQKKWNRTFRINIVLYKIARYSFRGVFV